jgi:hypothetical protein
MKKLTERLKADQPITHAYLDGDGRFDDLEASVVTDPALVIAGQSSVRLSNYGSLVTNPAVVPLAAHTTYILELQYRVLSYGSSDDVLWAWMQPPGNSDPQKQVAASPLLKNTEPAGTFSAGAESGSDASYTFWIAASAVSDVIVDNLVVYRQDSVQTNTAPAPWARLETAPFPRLGIWISATTFGFAQNPPAEGVPFLYPLDQVESRLAFADVVVGLDINNQTWYPDSIRRLRALNPNMIILPYRISEEQEQNIPPPTGASVDLSHQFLQSVADPWSCARLFRKVCG